MKDIRKIITEHLSARLLILQSVFSVGGCGPNFHLTLGIQLKVWLVYKHPSRLGMHLKVLVTKSCVHLHKFVISSTIAALAVPLL